MNRKKQNKPIYLPEFFPQKKSENKLKILAMIVIPFLVFLLWLSGSSLGKSLTEYIIQTKSQMAKPIVIVETDPMIKITKAEEEQTYTFTVKNYELEEISEIDMQYTIEILGNNDQLWKISLEKEGKPIPLNEQKTDWIAIKGNEKKEDHYQLKINYQNETVQVDENKQETIQLKVHAEQVKQEKRG